MTAYTSLKLITKFKLEIANIAVLVTGPAAKIGC